MTKLRAINGGGGDGSATMNDAAKLKEKWRQLARIRQAISMWRSGGQPPRSQKAAGLAVLCTVALVVIAHTVEALSPSVVMAALIASVVVFAVVKRLSNAANTHVDNLDRLLTAYDPVAKDAFRNLQTKVKNQGGLRLDMLDVWLEAESEAIRACAGWNMPERFLKKQV